MTADEIVRFQTTTTLIALMTASVSGPETSPKTNRSSILGAVGDKRLRVNTLGRRFEVRCPRRQRSRPRSSATVVAVILLVGTFGILLVQEHNSSIAKVSRPYTLDYLLWTVEGNQAGASFGSSVSSGGDVNNDGYDDVVVGAPGYDNPDYQEGRAYLYLGSSGGLSTSPSWTVAGDRIDTRVGCSVDSAGDVNNDGFDDVIVGALYYDVSMMDEGRAYLYLGSATGLSTTPSWTAEGDQDQCRFGNSVSSAGDVNNDGYDDVVIGAYAYDSPVVNAGRVFLYLGSPTGLSTTPSWTVEGNLAGGNIGASVSSAGDVNNDGYDDVIVGSSGTVFAYLGSSAGLSTTPSWTIGGASVSSAGDVNNDGYGDVVVGNAGYSGDLTYQGHACLYLGSPTGLSTTPSWTAEGDQADCRFGCSVSSAGDVNGDGRDDVIVGAFRYDNGQTEEGRAYLYLGSSGGLSVTPSWIAESDQANTIFGFSVSSAGDVNGDGLDEVIVGAPSYSSYGRAYAYGELLIPEFNVILIPVIGVVAIVVALRLAQVRRSDG